MATGGGMNVIYPYKRSPGDFELRYSLRSLINVPHDRVVIAGEVPFMTLSESVVTVRNPRVGDRYMSSTANIFAALDKAEITGDFIVMNDDIFVLQPWTFRHEDCGPIAECLTKEDYKGDYRARMSDTARILRTQGIREPLFYGLHTPTIYNREKLTDLMRQFPMPRYRYLLRTLYNNLFPRPSIRADDVKVKSWTDDSKAGDILSISDNVAALPSFKAWIDRRFPVPSVYEVA
jgi:hypothetical protein